MNDAYVAGLFDGEGMVRVAKLIRNDNQTYQVQVMIGMSHEGVISRLPALYGGSLHVNDHSKRSPNFRPQYCWRIASQKAYAFLKKIRPYLIVKADEVDLAFALQENINEYRFKLGNRYAQHENHDTVIAFRDGIYTDLMNMKRPHRAPRSRDKKALELAASHGQIACPPDQFHHRILID